MFRLLVRQGDHGNEIELWCETRDDVGLEWDEWDDNEMTRPFRDVRRGQAPASVVTHDTPPPCCFGGRNVLRGQIIQVMG